jgi:predicted MFS family arabinose efflux permease
MTMFIVQTVLLIAVAFGLGCLFGCWLKGRMAVHPPSFRRCRRGEPRRCRQDLDRE